MTAARRLRTADSFRLRGIKPCSVKHGHKCSAILTCSTLAPVISSTRHCWSEWLAQDLCRLSVSTGQQTADTHGQARLKYRPQRTQMDSSTLTETRWTMQTKS